jgi:hypothetical protein
MIENKSVSNPTNKPRPIDKIRNGALSIDINTPDDNSPISEMISAGERILIVKGKGIYEAMLADQVDPERTNIATQNTVQRILPYGADAPWVGATLLTAYQLFKNSSAQDTVDGDEAIAIVLEIVVDISGAHQLRDSYVKAETEATADLDPKIRSDRSIMLPAVGNVETRCNEFFQRGDHALRELFRLVRMFYPDVSSGGWESLKAKIDSQPQDIDNFPKFLAGVLPLLQLIRNARNCVEHPRPEQRLSVTDFALDSGNTLLPPMIKVQHPRTPLEKVPVRAFFSQCLQDLVSIVELMIVFLCARHVKPFGEMPIQVIEIPTEHRRSPHVRYGYGMLIGGQLVPFS